MTVAAGVLTALDQGVRAERVGPFVTLAGVLEPDRDQPVGAGDDVVRDAVGERPGVRAEVGVQKGTARVHAPQPGGAVRIGRQLGDVGVPDVVRGKHRAVGRARYGGACQARGPGAQASAGAVRGTGC